MARPRTRSLIERGIGVRVDAAAATDSRHEVIFVCKSHTRFIKEGRPCANKFALTPLRLRSTNGRVGNRREVCPCWHTDRRYTRKYEHEKNAEPCNPS